jgi:hypothetical protein
VDFRCGRQALARWLALLRLYGRDVREDGQNARPGIPSSTLRHGFEPDFAVRSSMKQGLSGFEGLNFGQILVVARRTTNRY